jgi:hypothetical protein
MAKQEKKQKKRFYPQIDAQRNEKLLEYSKKSNNEIFGEFKTSIHGLTDDQYNKSKEEFGSNDIGNKKKRR